MLDDIGKRLYLIRGQRRLSLDIQRGKSTSLTMERWCCLVKGNQDCPNTKSSTSFTRERWCCLVKGTQDCPRPYKEEMTQALQGQDGAAWSRAPRIVPDQTKRKCRKLYKDKMVLQDKIELE